MVKTFIRKGILTICLNLSILLIGLYTLPYLSNEFIPSVEVPAVAVIFPTPFMTAEKIKNEIIKPVENAFFESGDLESIETQTENERVVMILFYDWKYRPETCLRKARQVVENVTMPAEALDPIFILHRPTNRPILRTVLYGKDILEISKFAEKLSLELQRIPGVSQVSVVGNKPSRIELKIDPKKLAKHQINFTDIIKTSRESWSFRQYFKSGGIDNYMNFKVNTKDDIGLLALQSPNSDQQVLLRWIADVKEEQGKPSVIYGKDEHALIIEVIKGTGADTISIAESAIKKINEKLIGVSKIRAMNIYNESEKIRESQKGVITNFIIGVILNSFILIIFLGSSIGVLVASVVFPTSLLGTLFAQKYLGISINLFSLNGFSLAVGMITDASTVVLESIARRFQKGEEIFAACWRGTKDVSMGVLAATLTTAGVLIPIAMQKNISSKLFSDLSLTVVATQLFCLIAVFSLVPWLCFKMFKRDDKPFFLIGFFYRYTSILVSGMVRFAHSVHAIARRDRFYRIIIPGFFVTFNLALLFFLPQTEFLPAISAPVYSLNYPVGESIVESKGEKYRDQLALILNQRKDLIWSVATFGQNNVEILFELDKCEKISGLRSFFINKMKNNKSMMAENINIQAIGPAGGGEKFGFDGMFYLANNISEKTRDEIIQKFCSSELVDHCLERGFNRLYDVSLTPRNITTTRMGSSIINSAFELAIPLREVNLKDVGGLPFDQDVIMKIPPENDFQAMPMALGAGNITSLGNLFTSSIGLKKSLHIRFDGQDYSPLFFRLGNATLGEVSSFMSDILPAEIAGSSGVIGMGALKTMDESFSSMIVALIISAFIIFIILSVQFRSVRQATIIMGTIPLTVGGAIIGLIVMGETVNASVMVGFILLIGIVVNNGIFLMEATNQKLFAGLKMAQSVTEAVAERARPIMMTSFSTIFGMLPAIVLGGEGSELYRGMAIVNVFGMAFGTIMSLVITPIFIEYLGRRK